MRLLCLFAALSFLLAAGPALAERCKMIGCRGQVGYLFVPFADQVSGGKLKHNGTDYTVRTFLFGAPGLAKVNDEVTLGRDANLYTEAAIRAHIAEFRTVRPPRDGGNDFWDESAGGNLLETGARVRVLSYATFPVHAPSQQHYLFALVQVTAD